jgi:hypothetical protein
MTQDIYEFPADWIGRKTFVSVRGHSSSIPKPYTYRNAEGRNCLLPEYGGEPDNASMSIQIMPDIGEYTSVVDGTRISSRSHHREHIRRHELIEVGNERVRSTAGAQMSRSGQDIKQAIQQLRATILYRTLTILPKMA